MPIFLVRAGFEPLSVRRRDGAETVGEPADGLGAVQEVQVDAAGGVDRLRRELDDARRRVALDEVGRCLVDAARDPLERAREAVAVGLVLEDRRREVEDEDDVGAVGGGRARGRDEAAARQQGGDDDRDDDAGGWTEAIQCDPCVIGHEGRPLVGATAPTSIYGIDPCVVRTRRRTAGRREPLRRQSTALRSTLGTAGAVM